MSTLQINQQDVVFTQLDDEGVILNLRSKYYFTVNATGLRVWQLLQKGLDQEAIVEQLMVEYDIDAATCRADVAALLAGFKREALLL